MKSFRRGLRSRNPLVLVVALALVVPVLVGAQSYFASGRWTDVPLEYWLRTASDDYSYVSWVVGKVKRDPPQKPSLYLLGGSSARESIVSGASLAADVKREGGPDVAAWDLGSINQNFAQSLAVADNVPATPTYLLIGVGLGRFTSDRGSSLKQAEGRELLLESRFLQRYVARTYGKYKYTTTILPGVFSQLTSKVQQQGHELLSGKLPRRTYGQHRYNVRNSHTLAEKERMVTVWNKRRYPKFRRHLRFHLDMLEQLLVRSRQRGLHAVLVELPFNREIVGDRFDHAIAQYQAPVEALAAEYGVPYVDFNRDLRIPDGDFHDLSHLTEPGRVVWQRRLAGEVVTIMGEDAGAGGETQ